MNKEKITGKEVGHHIPQNAFNDTIGRTKNDGPALGMTIEDHKQTRTFAGKGAQTMRKDKGLSASNRLALDVDDVRNLFGDKYDGGLSEMLKYAKTLPEHKNL